MTELIARTIVGREERHLVLVEETYSDAGEPWTLFVNANHYATGRRTVERAFYWSLAAAQADCRERYQVRVEDWVSSEAIRFGHVFQFDFAVTNQGVPQPYPLGFDGAEVLFALGGVEHPDGPPTPVLNVSGNREGLCRLAALLLLCAESDRYNARFHVHLDREPAETGERPFLTSELDVTLRAPAYLSDLKDGSFRERSAHIDVAEESDEDDEPWKARPDA